MIETMEEVSGMKLEVKHTTEFSNAYFMVETTWDGPGTCGYAEHNTDAVLHDSRPRKRFPA